MTFEALAESVEEPFAWLVGRPQRSTYSVSGWLFLRILGLVYLIAFLSLWTQVQGLIGPGGILPAQDFLNLLGHDFGAERFRLVPTVFWLGAGATALRVGCAAGASASVLLILGLWPGGVLVILWWLYLSFVSVGQDFLQFQWDALLVETGLLAVLLAPGRLRTWRPTVEPSPIAVFLLWGLLFRLVFESGVVKLISGDPTWLHLTALDYHFFTQPLPTWTAWYANLVPEWLKRFAVLATLVVEIAAPILFFCGRRARLLGCATVAGLQFLILATGNYTFFNLLTLALGILLLDDQAWRRILPVPLLRLTPAAPGSERPPAARLATAVAAMPLLLLQLVSLTDAVLPGMPAPLPARRALAWLAPFASVNSYGLFRVMTTERPEIIIEGSEDGRTWKAYEFRYKPGALDRRPQFVEPHQPRLDWQMWFAALGRFDRTAWLQAFMVRLLQGAPEVVALLASDPFAGHPPRYLRAVLYDYRFTGLAERRSTGRWWIRRELGPYSPTVTVTDTVRSSEQN